jgi:ubiquinone/menaquinone biosynthesis C-methylase UbiE
MGAILRLMNRRDSYAPGWGPDVVAMVSARTADDRGAFVLPFLSSGMRLLDVGCGPGSITLGLARHVRPDGCVVGVDMQPSQIHLAEQGAATAGVVNATFQVANAVVLPLESASFDVVFAHALFEHLAAPGLALAEMARVLRPHGILGICSSDWSGARIEPDSADVRCAMQAHYALRRRAGGDPFAGARLEEWVSAAGFTIVHTAAEEKTDMSYADLATYVAARIREALSEAPFDSSFLEEAAAAASRWASHGVVGTAVQRWVHVIARR